MEDEREANFKENRMMTVAAHELPLCARCPGWPQAAAVPPGGRPYLLRRRPGASPPVRTKLREGAQGLSVSAPLLGPSPDKATRTLSLGCTRVGCHGHACQSGASKFISQLPELV